MAGYFFFFVDKTYMIFNMIGSSGLKIGSSPSGPGVQVSGQYFNLKFTKLKLK